MNGRIQDPWIGRFISADPFINDPLNTQDFNRYSYVHNNPLSATDPSGFRDRDVIDPLPFWPYPSIPGSGPGYHSPAPPKPACSPNCTNLNPPNPPPSQAGCPADLMTCAGGTSNKDEGWSNAFAHDLLGFGASQVGGAAQDVLDWICSVGISACDKPIFQAGGSNGGRYSGRQSRGSRNNGRQVRPPSPKWVQNSPRSANYQNIPGGNLRANDRLSGGDGHAIDRHVGRDVEYLRWRLRNEGKRVVSTYYTERLANEAVEAALSSVGGQVQLRNLERTGVMARIEYNVGYPVGMVLREGDLLPRHNAQRIVVLVIPTDNPQAPGGWVVLTSWLEE